MSSHRIPSSCRSVGGIEIAGPTECIDRSIVRSRGRGTHARFRLASVDAGGPGRRPLGHQRPQVVYDQRQLCRYTLPGDILRSYAPWPSGTVRTLLGACCADTSFSIASVCLPLPAFTTVMCRTEFDPDISPYLSFSMIIVPTNTPGMSLPSPAPIPACMDAR